MLQRILEYVDTMPMLTQAAAGVGLLFLIWLIWVALISKTAQGLDYDEWKPLRDAEGWLIGVARRQGHDEYAVPQPPKDLDGRLIRNRRLRSL
jgi:hypothetical protein